MANWELRDFSKSHNSLEFFYLMDTVLQGSLLVWGDEAVDLGAPELCRCVVLLGFLVLHDAHGTKDHSDPNRPLSRGPSLGDPASLA